MPLILTCILQVILVGLPTSTKRPVSLGHPTTFPTVLPSVLKVKWYPDCLLEFHPKMKPQKPPNQWFPLYTAFTVYLTTIDGQYLKTKNYRIWKEEESLRPTEVGTFTTPSFQLSYKGKKDFGISQILVKLFLKFFHLILRPPTLNGTGLNETFQRTNQVSLIVVARVGFEPTTPRLWALWATAALPHDI